MKHHIVYFGFQDVGNGNKIRTSNRSNSTKEARLICDVSFSVSSRCWRREFIEKNNMKFIEGMYYEDEIFCIKSLPKRDYQYKDFWKDEN